MQDESRIFLQYLLGQAQSALPHAYLTLSAIHPDRQHPVPSRHIALHDTEALREALAKLEQSNKMGWGAFVAVGLRKQDLGRWRRGGQCDVLALPALCVDIDAEPQAVLLRLHQHDPPPSCIVKSGAGLHAYWWLDEPTTDLVHVASILAQLRQQFASDPLSVSQSMRLPGSINTKPERHNNRCTLHSISPTSYPLHAFVVENRPSTRTSQTSQTGQTSHTASTNGQQKRDRIATPRELNPRLIEVVSGLLERRYGGFWRRSGWLAARCPCPHEHDQPGAHFSFNPAIGLGVCLGKHGRLLLKDLCTLLGIHPADYGGLFR